MDAVYQLGPSAESRRSALQQVEQLAVARAVAAGAIPDTCQVRNFTWGLRLPAAVPLEQLGGSLRAGAAWPCFAACLLAGPIQIPIQIEVHR